MEPKKILIVDDQSFIRQVFSQQLKGELEGITIIEAANGSEAIGKAKVSKPDLILLDIVMPTTDGFKVLEELAADPHTYEIPILVVSSHADDENVSRAKELGAREFVDKASLNDIDFVGLVRRYLYADEEVA